LLKPDKESENLDFPLFTFTCGDKEKSAIVQQQKGLWSWYSVITGPDVKSIRTLIRNSSRVREWSGTASVYLICQQLSEGSNVTFTTKSAVSSRPMPPLPFARGISEKIIKVDEIRLTVR